MLDEGFDKKTLASLPQRYTLRTDARFQDIDAAGFLFFARVYDYFHDSWLAYMASAGLKHAETLQAREWGAPLKRSHAEYLAPVRFGDALEVGIVRARWRGSDLIIGYQMKVTGGPVAAVGFAHHVIVEMATMRRTTPPAKLHAVFAAFSS